MSTQTAIHPTVASRLLSPRGIGRSIQALALASIALGSQFASAANSTVVNAYPLRVTGGSPLAEKEQNSFDIDFTAPTGSVSIDDGQIATSFSGNDVVAGLTVGGTTYYGWISRPIKDGGVVRGFYMWIDAQFNTLAAATSDGNADADGGADNIGFALVFDQAWFTAQTYKSGSSNTLKTIGSSSDRVDSALNSVAVAASVLSITNITVNEASPYAVFTISGGTASQLVSLALSDGTAGSADYGSGLEYYNGSTWLTYTSGTVALNGSGSLMVRTPIKQDAPYEISETFKLTATSGGTGYDGTATIKDDGTGDIFKNDGTTDPTVIKDDDRPLTVNNVTVNEASPYLVFTVSGAASQKAKLSLTAGTATLITDFGSALQYYDGSAWQNYTADSYVSLNGSGSLMVRTAIVQDAAYEISETFTLVAANTGGSASTGGLGTIKDDGTGDIFKNDGTTDSAVIKDDDRPLTVNNVTVNEASPYLVFTVSGAASQKAKLILTAGTATLTTDFGPSLQYFDGTTWQNYTADTYVSLNGSGSLMVRTAIVQDAAYEISENFTLTAANTGGTNNNTSGADKGIGTIKDDGTGDIFKNDGTTDSAVTKDDDRPLTVNNVTVNEASPYLVFTVSGVASQKAKLSLTAGTATLSTDFGSALQYYDGSAWQNYTADSYVSLNGSGSLMVRTAIVQDAIYENSETFTLTAANTGGTNNNTSGADKGIGTIKDDGTGDIFKNDGTTDPSVTKDDDRPLTVNNVTVNETGSYAVFTVSGAASQKLKLSLASGSALLTGDFGPSLQYSSNGGSTWNDYTPDSYVSLTAGGTLKVRTPITSDAVAESTETFTLIATNTGGTNNDTTGANKGIGTITEEAGILIEPVNATGFKLNRENGLYEQSLRITNLNSSAIQGFRFTLDLPEGAKLFNANSVTSGGVPVPAISYHHELAPNAYVDIEVKVLYQPLSSTNTGAGATLNGLGLVAYNIEWIITDPSTAPNKPDRDDDGLSDEDEINTYHTNPDSADSDGDGVTDWAELFVMNSNPNVKASYSGPSGSTSALLPNYRVVRGSYEGLLSDDGSGLTSKISLLLSTNGGFSGNVVGPFGMATLRGKFAADGTWSGSSSNPAFGTVNLTFVAQANGSFYLDGSMAGGTVLFQARPARSSVAQKVTFKASLVDSDGGPTGAAVATGNITAAGKVALSVYLPDGKRASYSGFVLDDNRIALYVQAKGGDAPVLLGDLTISPLDPAVNLGGDVRLFTDHYDQQRSLQGSFYRVPAKNALPLSGIPLISDNVALIWEEGAFADIVRFATWSPSKVSVANSPLSKTSVSYDRKTGLIKTVYRCTDAASALNGKTATAYAVVIEGMNLTQGFYTSPSSSGSFAIRPALD